MISNFQIGIFRTLITIFIVFSGLCCIFIGIYELEYFLNQNVAKFILKFISVYALGVVQIYFHKTITKEIIDSMIGKMEEQSKFE